MPRRGVQAVALGVQQFEFDRVTSILQLCRHRLGHLLDKVLLILSLTPAAPASVIFGDRAGLLVDVVGEAGWVKVPVVMLNNRS